MRLKSTLGSIATILLAMAALRGPDLRASGWYFGNADVFSLLGEGMSDSAIITKIAKASTVVFKLEPEDLLALKNAGASLPILAAMLARVRQSSGNGFGPDVMPTFKSLKADTVPLVTRQGRLEIGFSRGEQVVEGMGPNPSMHLDFPGLHASIRTTDPRPSVLVRAESDPTKRYFFTRLISVEKLKIRSMKGKAKMRAFRNDLLPAKDWMIPCTVTAEDKGLWRITPQADLEPGEYGLLDGVRLFELGIDLP